MAMVHGDRPGTVKAVIGLELFNGFMGVVSGLALLVDSSGAFLGLNTDILEGLPIGDFFSVGIFLLIAFGVCPLIASWGLISKSDLSLSRPLKKISLRHWAWTGALVLSAAEMVWMAVEVVLIGVFPFTYIWLIMQMLIIVVLSVGNVRRYYA
ncbi:MAG: hypothetical protein IH630_06405 [Thermoplasmata archaeon]|nr:hypothetical protein [Thermoplasmata archaeon]MCJ7561472.1 hypothetical protein [Thermoplasmata archaeon]TFG70700.1 MAG: hypothetical protein E4H25_01330 [Methanomassiliicoccus sp.]